MHVLLLQVSTAIRIGISLCHDDGDGIIEYTLPKHEHAESGVDVQGMEDGQRGNRVHCRYQSSKGETGGTQRNDT